MVLESNLTVDIKAVEEETMEVIYIYAECSNLAGSRCYRDADGRDDINQHDVSIAEYKRLRRIARTVGAGRDLYLLRCAQEVIKALR